METLIKFSCESNDNSAEAPTPLKSQSIHEGGPLPRIQPRCTCQCASTLQGHPISRLTRHLTKASGDFPSLEAAQHVFEDIWPLSNQKFSFVEDTNLLRLGTAEESSLPCLPSKKGSWLHRYRDQEAFLVSYAAMCILHLKICQGMTTVIEGTIHWWYGILRAGSLFRYSPVRPTIFSRCYRHGPVRYLGSGAGCCGNHPSKQRASILRLLHRTFEQLHSA